MQCSNFDYLRWCKFQCGLFQPNCLAEQNVETVLIKNYIYILFVHFLCVTFHFRALQFPPEAWLRISLNHASITWITIRPSGRVGIRMLGESGFMPIEKSSVL